MEISGARGESRIEAPCVFQKNDFVVSEARGFTGSDHVGLTNIGLSLGIYDPDRAVSLDRIF